MCRPDLEIINRTHFENIQRKMNAVRELGLSDPYMFSIVLRLLIEEDRAKPRSERMIAHLTYMYDSYKKTLARDSQ